MTRAVTKWHCNDDSVIYCRECCYAYVARHTDTRTHALAIRDSRFSCVCLCVSLSIGTLFHSHHKYWTILTFTLRALPAQHSTAMVFGCFLICETKLYYLYAWKWMDWNLWKRYKIWCAHTHTCTGDYSALLASREWENLLTQTKETKFKNFVCKKYPRETGEKRAASRTWTNVNTIWPENWTACTRCPAISSSLACVLCWSR